MLGHILQFSLEWGQSTVSKWPIFPSLLSALSREAAWAWAVSLWQKVLMCENWSFSEAVFSRGTLYLGQQYLKTKGRLRWILKSHCKITVTTSAINLCFSSVLPHCRDCHSLDKSGVRGPFLEYPSLILGEGGGEQLFKMRISQGLWKSDGLF